MLTLAQVVDLLWFVSTFLQAGVLVLIIKGGLRKDFPYFMHFTLFQVVTSVMLYGIDRWGNYAAYFYFYWATSAVGFLLSFAIIHEIFSNAFKPYIALRDFAGILFRWAALVLLLVAAILAFYAPAGEDHIVAAVLGIERSVMVMQAGMLLFLMMFSSRLGLTWKHHSFGIMLGFGIYACGQLVLSTLRSQMGMEFADAYTIGQSVLYTAQVSIWGVYLISPEPARIAVETAFAPRPILERWNQVLAGDNV